MTGPWANTWGGDTEYQRAELRAIALVSEGHCPDCATRLVEGLGPYGWCIPCNQGFAAQRNRPGDSRYELTGDAEYTRYWPMPATGQQPPIGPAPGTWHQPHLPTP